MNFRDVEYIVKIAECGSINRAAKELYVAQPSLSKCIKKVEDEYDIQLFYRNRGSSINLTVEGQAFLDMARPVLELYHHFEQQLQELKEKNRSRIVFGTAPAKGYSISSALFKNLYLEYDKYFLDLRTGKSLDLENGVLSGDLDMVMITVDSYREGLHYEELYENEEFIYLREGSPAAERATYIDGIDWPVLRLEDVEDEPIVANTKGSANRKILDRLMEEHDIHLDIYESPYNADRVAMVQSGRATYFLALNRNRISGGSDRGTFYYLHPDQQIRSKVCLICREGFEKDERFTIVRDILKDIESPDQSKVLIF